MNLSLIDKDFDNTVGVDGDGQFEVNEVVEEFLVETVGKDENLNNDDDE